MADCPYSRGKDAGGGDADWPGRRGKDAGGADADWPGREDGMPCAGGEV